MVDVLLLCHVSAGPKRMAVYLGHEGQPAKLLFLCQDYLELMDWQRVIENRADHLEVGPMLNHAAEQLRKPFLDLITELGRRHNSVAWWASRLSERNVMVNPLFLYCCYFKIGQKVLDSIEGTFPIGVLFVFSNCNKKCIKRNLNTLETSIVK